MDNNNQTPQATSTAPNMPPAAPQPAAPVQMPDTSSNGSNKIILWFVIGLVIVVLAVGGIYVFLSRQQAATQNVQQPTVQTTPKPQDTADALDKDLNSINVDTGTNSDFDSIDQDLQQL